MQQNRIITPPKILFASGEAAAPCRGSGLFLFDRVQQHSHKLNPHLEGEFFSKNFFIPESTLQVIPLRLVIGRNGKGVSA